MLQFISEFAKHDWLTHDTDLVVPKGILAQYYQDLVSTTEYKDQLLANSYDHALKARNKILGFDKGNLT